jgi:cation diffusion facilitator family transporter
MSERKQMSKKSESEETQRLLLVSALVDLGLAVMKVLVGWFANSHALIADGIHSFSDLATDAMVWILNRIGTEEPDEDHPYGHARFETLGSLILGVILMVVAGSLVYDSVIRLIAIEMIKTPAWPALLAAAVSIAANEWLYKITRKLGEKFRSNLLVANAWHHRSDALSSIIVLIGVGGAILGVTWLEMVAAIGVAFMIALVGLRLVKESVEELVDTALSDTYVTDIQQTIKLADGVHGVHSLRTRRMGSAVILDIHLQVEPFISVSEGHHIGDWVSYQLKKNFKEITDITVHIDAEDDEETPQDSILPLRKEVRSDLVQAWVGLLEEKEILKVTLHYFESKINVEVFLVQDLDEDSSDEEHPGKGKSELQQNLAKSGAHLPWLGEVTLWSK